MKYKSGYKYQVVEKFYYKTDINVPTTIVTPYIILFSNGLLYIKVGYAWDGPSGPTIDTDNSMTPSLVHDALAQLMRWELLDPKWLDYINILFDKMLEDRGMFWARRLLWHSGLEIVGGNFTNPTNRKKIHEVA